MLSIFILKFYILIKILNFSFDTLLYLKKLILTNNYCDVLIISLKDCPILKTLNLKSLIDYEIEWVYYNVYNIINLIN